jgi:hypothetical protein
MTKTQKTNHRPASAELDSVYLLKLVMYLILGSLWIRIGHASSTIPIPIGLIVGGIFAMHDHFKIDRKIEYAVLLIAMFVGFWSQAGLMLTF